MLAFVLVRLHKGEEELLRFMEKQRHVREVHIVYGEYDVILKVEVENLRELSHLVLDEIRKRFDVERTSTLIVTES